MKLRISGGEFKGRKISSKKRKTSSNDQDSLRPTSAKVRESIFNIIAGIHEGFIFIDLYAGTGAVGIEAISRGAAKVFFIETDRKRSSYIQKMIDKYNCADKADVTCSCADDFIRNAIDEGMKADVIFVDPPYHSNELDNIMEILSDGQMLSDDGIIIAEHHSKKKLSEETGNLRQKKTYKYGDTTLTLFRKAE
ncbi:MAG: 16S rRNA (guanine(966)-N(2))-methyltransferase RsmD [Nitrospiraceae bacterium]|nr:16S rRNA (guanine(966)-N(2))-methyltransferase RsmD [Nitrospiraceae bacterium]